MKHLLIPLVAVLLAALTASSAQTAANAAPLRVAIAGMVHGHVEGFLQHSLHRADIQIVGIAEPDRQVAARYAAQFNLDRGLLFADLEEMLQKTHPQAVLAYTNT
ncbi:MAG: Gfo/Idh/MocA family protein, partial [Terriglobales bacterium]